MLHIVVSILVAILYVVQPQLAWFNKLTYRCPHAKSHRPKFFILSNLSIRAGWRWFPIGTDIKREGRHQGPIFTPFCDVVVINNVYLYS